MVERIIPPASTPDRVWTRADLEELLGGPRRARAFDAKLAAKLKDAQARRQRITVEFDPQGPTFAVHFVEREAL